MKKVFAAAMVFGALIGSGVSPAVAVADSGVGHAAPRHNKPEPKNDGPDYQVLVKRGQDFWKSLLG